MAKKNRSYALLLIGVFTLLAVGSWVSFDVIRGLTNTTITEVQQQQIEPLKVDVSEETIDLLLSRKRFDQLTLQTIQSRAVPVDDKGKIVVIEEASASGVIVETAPVVASGSGLLEGEGVASESGSLGVGL